MKFSITDEAKAYIQDEEKKRGKLCVVAIAESQYRS